MPNITNIEAIAFYEDLNHYMDKEASADKRAEWVEAKVKELMAGEYSPFLPDNVTEALSELSFADSCLMADYIKMCADHPDNVDNHVHLSDFVVDLVQDYWHGCAVKHAQNCMTMLDFNAEVRGEPALSASPARLTG